MRFLKKHEMMPSGRKYKQSKLSIDEIRKLSKERNSKPDLKAMQKRVAMEKSKKW